MTRFAVFVLMVFVVLIPCVHGEPAVGHSRFWHHWRGPLGTGVAPGADPPITWSEKENVRWKTSIPGKGHSSPVVWGDRIYLTAAVPFGDQLEPVPETAPGAHDNLPVTQRHRFLVIAVRRNDGRILWQRVVKNDLPHEGGHYTGSLASASPVTDGNMIFASFGSRGIYALDRKGNLVWKVDLGKMQTKHAHGEGSSPLLWKNTLVVNWDHEGQSFLVAFDKRTGRELWRVDRNERTSWASPIVVEQDGKPQVIVSGTRFIRGYDLSTGKVIWQCSGLSDNVVASPVYSDGMLFAGSSYEKQALLGIRLDGATGDLTGGNRVVWQRRRSTPYVPSLLLYGDFLYFLSHYQGILSRVEARTGDEPSGPFRLGDLRNIYASPVAAADRVYITDLDGTTMVINHGPVPRVLASNRLDDQFSASAALVDDELFLRGLQFLYCIAEKNP